MFFFPLVVACGLGSCGTKEREGDEVINGKARIIDLQSSDKYNWRRNVEVGEDGTIMGGKRSQYDDASSNQFRKNYKTPDYLKKGYATKKWQGQRDFSAGSFEGRTVAREGGQASRWADSASRESTLRSRADGNSYATERFQTGSAREGGFEAVTRTPNAEAAYRQRTWGEKWEIFTPEGYRDMTVAETRGLLGR